MEKKGFYLLLVIYLIIESCPGKNTGYYDYKIIGSDSLHLIREFYVQTEKRKEASYELSSILCKYQAINKGVTIEGRNLTV